MFLNSLNLTSQINMENPCVEQFMSSLAQSLNPGYPEFISRLNFSDCRKELDLLLNEKRDAQTASKGPLLRCMLLILHRQTSLSVQTKAAMEQEVENLRVQNASLLQEVQTANKKAMLYLENLHSAELDLCSHKEELFRLRSELPAPLQSFSRCDSGYSESHSSLGERLTPPPFRWEQLPPDPKSLGTKSAPQSTQTCRGNSPLTSHLSDLDHEETHSVVSSTYTAPWSPSPLNMFTCALPPKGRTRICQDCPSSYLQQQESDDRCSAPVFQTVRPVAQKVNVQDSLVSPSSDSTTQCPRLEVLELIAKDIEPFNPDNGNCNLENYLSELDHQLVDLPDATQREKVKLVWKTSSKAVHKFMQTLPFSIRDNYQDLCTALLEEFSSPADEISGIVAASQIKHSRLEHPRDFYRRFRHAYFQGKNAPGMEENSTFKSLFMKNLHPSIRSHVTLKTLDGKPSMHEVRKMTQMAWETLVSSKDMRKNTELSSSNTHVSSKPSASRPHPHYTSKGGDKRSHRDTERNRRVHQLRRDRHSHSRSCKKPYAEIVAQNYEQSDDDHSISDHSEEHGQPHSDNDSISEGLPISSYQEHYSPDSGVRKHQRRKSSRASSSHYS